MPNTLQETLLRDTERIIVKAIKHLLTCGYSEAEIALNLDIHKELGLTPARIFDLTVQAKDELEKERQSTADHEALHLEIGEIIREIRGKIEARLSTLSVRTITQITEEIANLINTVIGLASSELTSKLRSEIRELSDLSSKQAIWLHTTIAQKVTESAKKSRDKAKNPDKIRTRREKRRTEERAVAKKRRRGRRPRPQVTSNGGCTAKKSFGS